MSWTKEEALTTLRRLADEADQPQMSKVPSAEHTRWVTNCLDILEEVLGPASRYYQSFVALGWGESDSSKVDGFTLEELLRSQSRIIALGQDLEKAKGLLLGAADYLERHELDEAYDAKNTGPESSLILKVLHLAEHNLRKVVRTQPDKERQVQDAFESLLIGADIPYGREVDKIEYSSKTYTPDFSLPKISLAVEIKLCSRNEREKEIIAEINDDILAYQTKYPNLLFIVYDLGCIRDVDRFCNSFEEHENVTMRVVKL